MRSLTAGLSLKECAVQLKLSYPTVLKYARQPAFLAKLKEYSLTIYGRVDKELQNSKESILTRLEEVSADALEKLASLMDDPTAPPVVQFKAAQDLCDRDPRISRTKRVEGNVDHKFINPALLILASQTAQEVKRFKESEALGDGNTIDVTQPSGD